jgi:hypothetical protein
MRRVSAYFHRYTWEKMAITIAKSPAGKLPPRCEVANGAGLEGNSCFAATVFVYRFLFVGLCFPQIRKAGPVGPSKNENADRSM